MAGDAALGSAAYLLGRFIARKLAAVSLFAVKDAPFIMRYVYSIFLTRNPKLELIHQALEVISPGLRITDELASGIWGWRFERGVMVQEELSGLSALIAFVLDKNSAHA